MLTPTIKKNVFQSANYQNILAFRRKIDPCDLGLKKYDQVYQESIYIFLKLFNHNLITD